MARPTKFTKERTEAICEKLRNGCTRKAAAGAAGVDFQTFLNWLARYSCFSTAVSRAEDEAEAVFTQAIADAAPKDWRAAESWLKRRRGDEWGDKQKLDVRNLSTEQLITLLQDEDPEGARPPGGDLPASEGEAG